MLMLYFPTAKLNILIVIKSHDLIWCEKRSALQINSWSVSETKMFYMWWHANCLRVKISFQVSRPPIITCNMTLKITSNKTVVRPNDKRLLKKKKLQSLHSLAAGKFLTKIVRRNFFFFFFFFERGWNRRRNGNHGLYWEYPFRRFVRVTSTTLRPLTMADAVPPAT